MVVSPHCLLDYDDTSELPLRSEYNKFGSFFGHSKTTRDIHYFSKTFQINRDSADTTVMSGLHL